MKKFDVSAPVMKKIIAFENKRSQLQRYVIYTVFLICIFVIIFGVWDVYDQVRRQGSLDVLELFGEDWEIITLYWKEVIDTFWSELPQGAVIIILLFIGVFTAYAHLTKQKRYVIDNRTKSIKNYHSKITEHKNI